MDHVVWTVRVRPNQRFLRSGLSDVFIGSGRLQILPLETNGAMGFNTSAGIFPPDGLAVGSSLSSPVLFVVYGIKGIR